MLLWATFSGVQFGTYEQFQKMDPLRGTVVADTPSGNAPGGGRSEGGRGWRARAKDDEDEADGGSGGRRWGVSRGARNFLYGATSGAVATVATYPLDVARTALAYQVGCVRGAKDLTGVCRRRYVTSRVLSRCTRLSVSRVGSPSYWHLVLGRFPSARRRRPIGGTNP